MWKEGLSKALCLKKMLNSNDSNTILEKILEPLSDLSFDSEDSDASDLTDIFGEFHRNSFLRPNADPNKKYLTKKEADWKILESFSEEFKEAMKDVRQELAIGNSMFDDEASVEEALTITRPIQVNRTAEKEDSIIIDKTNPSRRSSSNSTVESKTWQMLLSNSTGNFEITPPIYDTFRRKEKHWLQRPGISWKTVDDSRLKCENWLDTLV